MKKLYRLYIVLATFVVLTTAFIVLVQRNVMNAFGASAAASDRFVSHKTAYERLYRLAGAAEAAANKVFENGDIEGQSRQMSKAFDEFKLMIQRERDQIIRTENPAEARLHLKELNDVEAAMADVIEESRLCLAALKAGNSDEAVAWMARMNRDHDRVRAR